MGVNEVTVVQSRSNALDIEHIIFYPTI